MKTILRRLGAGKKAVAIAIALLFGILSLSVFPKQVQAAVYHPLRGQVATVAPICSQGQCDGKDPYKTNCAGNGASYEVLAVAYLTDPNTGYEFGYLQLWWSFSCQTNWARYVCLHASSCPAVHYEVLSVAGANEPKYNSGGVTAQLYLPKTRSRADADLDGWPSFGTETGWY